RSLRLRNSSSVSCETSSFVNIEKSPFRMAERPSVKGAIAKQLDPDGLSVISNCLAIRIIAHYPIPHLLVYLALFQKGAFFDNENAWFRIGARAMHQ
ncbi:MAG: hypothetical protein PUH92_04095, partial [Bacilli bacterium]|nr:hypothetical protein [Bacilli bacterium]